MAVNRILVRDSIRGRQGGLAVVEFVIVLPLIILITYAMVELGRGLYHYNTLHKAVHDGARFLADDIYIGNPGGDIFDILDDDPDLRPETKNLVVYGDVDCDGSCTAILNGLDVGDVTVTTKRVILTDGGTDHNHVVVIATHTLPLLLFPESVFGFSLTPTFTATAVERALKI